MALFVSFSESLMAERSPDSLREEGWSVERAEELLRTLAGVVSVRVVASPDGEVEEIHVLTTEDVGPKQTVRNVESALLAHLDKAIHHRTISVAQTAVGAQGGNGGVNRVPGRVTEERILLLGHEAEPERSHKIRIQVQVEAGQGSRVMQWRRPGFTPYPYRDRCQRHPRGVEAAVAAGQGEDEPRVTLALEGVRLVDAFERVYALVAVHATSGREKTRLSGAAIVDGTPDRAVILAILQATDRWVRGA